MTHLDDMFAAQSPPQRPPIAGRLVSALDAANLTIAVAESLTGGLITGELTAIPGASQCVVGGVVTYATPSKTDVLKIPREIISAHGPVHSTTAAAMARHVRLLFNADIGLASTGVAGPEPLGDVPPGVVYVAVDVHRGPAQLQRLHLAGGRLAVRSQTVGQAISLVMRALAQRPLAPASRQDQGPDTATLA